MSIQKMLLLLVFWLSVAGIYMLSLYLDSIKYQTGFVLSWPMIATTALVYCFWGLLTVVLYRFLKRPIINGDIVKIISLFIFIYLIWQPLILIIDSFTMRLFLGQEQKPILALFSNIRFVSIFFNTVLYIIVFIVCAVFIYYQYSQQMELATARLEKIQSDSDLRMSEMQMQTLQSQLSPHFMFNSLNSISALTRANEKDKVIQAVARLGDLLRYAVSASKQPLINVKEEIKFIDHYLALQKLRFGQRFSLSIKTDTVSKEALCPPFILHTLVENVFTHAVEGSLDAVKMHVEVSQSEQDLVFKTENTNTVDVCQQKNGLGQAMENLRKRLDIIYSGEFLLTHKKTGNQYISLVQIPNRYPNE